MTLLCFSSEDCPQSAACIDISFMGSMSSCFSKLSAFFGVKSFVRATLNVCISAVLLMADEEFVYHKTRYNKP